MAGTPAAVRPWRGIPVVRSCAIPAVRLTAWEPGLRRPAFAIAVRGAPGRASTAGNGEPRDATCVADRYSNTVIAVFVLPWRPQSVLVTMLTWWSRKMAAFADLVRYRLPTGELLALAGGLSFRGYPRHRPGDSCLLPGDARSSIHA
jgi:hypothetical protein